MLHLEPSRENPDRSLKPSPLDKPGFIEVSGLTHNGADPLTSCATLLVSAIVRRAARFELRGTSGRVGRRSFDPDKNFFDQDDFHEDAREISDDGAGFPGIRDGGAAG